MIRWWVGLWDRREHPRSLALVRILMGLVILWDLLEVLRRDLVLGLFASYGQGGMVHLDTYGRLPEYYQLFEATAASAWGLYLACLLGALGLTLGLFTRVSGVVLVLAWAQWALILAPADRGIDMAMRNVVVLLVLSGSHRCWSLDALLLGRSWSAPERLVQSWPRYLLVVQLVIIYFAAGVSKVASSWTPFGEWSALYIAMCDPAFRKLDEEVVRAIFPLSQLGTAVSWVWEWMSPVLLLALHYRDSRTSPGKLRSILNRSRFVLLFLSIGATFHLGTWLVLQLGIFPFAMLAFYPACFHPDEVRAVLQRLVGLAGIKG